MRMVRALVSGLAMLAMAGCGGGGSSDPGAGAGIYQTPRPAPDRGSGSPSGASGWTPNVFQPASSFKNFCATPRVGNDIQGKPFPDQSGSLQSELNWLRSWTHETYLWNTEVTDQNPASFTDRIAYFNVLKTTATTSSGSPKDKFHFTMNTADFLAQQISAGSASYGAEIAVLSATPPRDVRVLYTQAGTPATQLLAGTPKLMRGAKILVADGVDVVNGGATPAEIDTLNAALFPTTASATHTLLVQYADGTQRSVTMTAASIVETPVNRTAVFNTAAGKVGYVLLNTFSPYSTEESIFDAMTTMKSQGVSDLVLDLRYNGGGLLAVASQLAYQVAGSTPTNGRTFEYDRFNALAGSLDPVTGQTNSPMPFYANGVGFTVAAGTPLPSLGLPRVFVLSTSSTCSASEAVINGLRGVNVDVVLIGTTTCGKPYGFYPQDNCGETYFSIQFQGVNDKGFGDYADGFAPNNSSAAAPVKIPGCTVADDFSHDLGDASEAMLAAALNYRATGTCPPPPATSLAPKQVGDGLAIATTGRSTLQQVLRSNRNLATPGRVD